MKYTILFFLLHVVFIAGFCQSKRSAGLYTVPDSIKAIGFYAEMKITETKKKSGIIPGISANNARIDFNSNKKYKSVEFSFTGKMLKTGSGGIDVSINKSGFSWKYEWKLNENYTLLIMTASDSASNSTIFSGYVYLADEKKWKLIGTATYVDTTRIRFISPAINTHKHVNTTYSNRWLLRNNNTWKALDSQITKAPVIRPMSNIDSLLQQKSEEISLMLKHSKDNLDYKEGIFYKSIKEGSGRLVNITDTVVVFYKGTLFSDGSLFDETKDKPATFPLSRLIKGWQLGVPHCRVGGKIRLYIPSGSAYGIRTFATDIPPNSTLVFDVEVLEVKEKVVN